MTLLSFGETDKALVPIVKVDADEGDYYSDVGHYSPLSPVVLRKHQRTAKKRADIQTSARCKQDRITPSGSVWACCCASEILLSKLQLSARRRILSSSRLELRFDTFFSDVFFAYVDLRKRHSKAGSQAEAVTLPHFSAPTQRAYVFVFKFGCIAAWDLPYGLQKDLLVLLEPFMREPLMHVEEDSMDYVWASQRVIQQDIIHVVSDDSFERLAYSYGFAQSCKLSVFEDRVDQTIERTRAVPENLARTGKIAARRDEISRRIGELFIDRFYINLHTDILDTPDVFWEFEEFSDHYTSCRSYLEIPKRVEILNQRLDIIKDLYDMLNQELTIQHGYKLEWIVIYLICVEVFISVVWGILIKDILKLV